METLVNQPAQPEVMQPTTRPYTVKRLLISGSLIALGFCLMLLYYAKIIFQDSTNQALVIDSSYQVELIKKLAFIIGVGIVLFLTGIWQISNTSKKNKIQITLILGVLLVSCLLVYPFDEGLFFLFSVPIVFLISIVLLIINRKKEVTRSPSVIRIVSLTVLILALLVIIYFAGWLLFYRS